MSEEPFRIKYGSELRSDALQVEYHRRRRCWDALLDVEQRVPLGFHSLDLLEQHFEPIEFAADLDLEMLGQGTPVARFQFIELSSAIAIQRLVSGCDLRG